MLHPLDFSLMSNVMNLILQLIRKHPINFYPNNFSAVFCIFPINLVGNVADMSPRVVAMRTMSAENGRRHNVANIVTGFKAGSRVS